MMPLAHTLALAFALTLSSQAEPYADWQHSAPLYLLTTQEGANLPAEASLEDFPVLVRLHNSFFDFAQARPGGQDLRFSSADGTPLAYQIELWDAAAGTAAIWVRVPLIRGDERQRILAFWGHPDAPSESSGQAVFNASNGFLSVWHLGELIADEVGTLTSTTRGTSTVPGVVGQARHLAGGEGLFGGEQIPDYPAGAADHTTAAWFRPQAPNSTIIGWGNEGGGRGSKVRMQLRSPPHLRIDSDFSDVVAHQRIPLGGWVHVAYTHSGATGEGRIYVDGQLAASATQTMDIKSPARLWLGGWYHNYDFIGDLDEVRISQVARSDHWVRLCYENQRPLQTLVGPLVQPGSNFALSHSQLTLAEDTSATFTAQAGGALKLFWIVKRAALETVVAVDTLSYTFPAGRVAGDTQATLILRAIYPEETTAATAEISIQERIPDPQFTLATPTVWDGRTPLQIKPLLANLPALQDTAAADLQFAWSLSGPAVDSETAGDHITLTRALGDGSLTVTLTLDNGGAPTSQSSTILITQPAKDLWQRRPGPDRELPADGQFYARDDTGAGTLFANGTLDAPATSLTFRIFQGDELFSEQTLSPGLDLSFAFSAKLAPALVRYRVELSADGQIFHAATDILCGDAYLIQGQSNAVATDFGPDDPPPPCPWVRTFGSRGGTPLPPGASPWSTALARSPDGESEIGYWGVELARALVELHQIPICIINGAVGGSRIDQHQRHQADPTDPATIYGRLLSRVRQAGLEHGIRGIWWHQGENDQGADGPTGGFGWQSYRQLFHQLAASWHRDFPNLQHIHTFQIWPRACSMGFEGSDNHLREVQRTLPRDFTNLSVISTLGIRPPGTCHYPAEGYAGLARLLLPLVRRDHYSFNHTDNVTAPDLIEARFTSPAKDGITLIFDQPIHWEPSLISEFYLDGLAGQVATGHAEGHVLRLRLAAPSTATTITYLDSRDWAPENILRGTNDIAALTFCETPLLPPKP